MEEHGEHASAAALASARRARDKLKKNDKISDRTWQILTQFYSTQQIMDVIFLSGQFNMVSWFLNSFQVEQQTAVMHRDVQASQTYGNDVEAKDGDEL